MSLAHKYQSLIRAFQCNVFIDSEGAARLADFGIATIDEGGQSYFSMVGMGGAVAYVAPELIAAENPRPTTASDIYTFGHVCAEVRQFSQFWFRICLIYSTLDFLRLATVSWFTGTANPNKDPRR